MATQQGIADKAREKGYTKKELIQTILKVADFDYNLDQDDFNYGDAPQVGYHTTRAARGERGTQTRSTVSE